MYKVLVLDNNILYNVTVSKLFVLDRNTWYHLAVWLLLLNRNSYLKPFNFAEKFQVILT